MNFDILAPCVYRYDFDEKLAKDLVTMFDEFDKDQWRQSAIGSSNNSEQDIRTSKEFPFEREMPISAEKVKRLFVSAVDNYCQQNGVIVMQDERLNLLKYEGGEKYNFHADADWTLYRVVSGLIYLNPSDYEGGETYFKNFDIDVKPEKPSIVIFPSNYAYSHMAKPVTNGRKYIFVTWMNDMPVGFSPYILSNLANSVGAQGAIHDHGH